eukprot:TRINITY_DN15891_c0_g2_i1.p1 TRINITY_DN15891_c0_g2~~TRINITY_DN15891_c0_g2_i1.p1  ORF type:complete len:661 (-),score=71.78 TRINITY_DN15891_c0_g2_i1:165-2147(-)
MSTAKSYKRTKSLPDDKHGQAVFVEVGGPEDPSPHEAECAKDYLTETEPEKAPSSKWRLFLAVAFIAIIVLGIFLAFFIPFYVLAKDSKGEKDTGPQPVASDAVVRVCNYTENPSVCQATLASQPGASTATDEELITMVLSVAKGMVVSARGVFEVMKKSERNDTLKAIADSCSILLDDADDALDTTIAGVQQLRAGEGDAHSIFESIKQEISAALTNNDDCVTDLAPYVKNSKVAYKVYTQVTSGDQTLGSAVSIVISLPNISPDIAALLERAKNALTEAERSLQYNLSQVPIFAQDDLSKLLNESALPPDVAQPPARRLLSWNIHDGSDDDDIPDWARRGLAELVNPAKIDYVVDFRGTGNFRTLKECLAAIPSKNTKRITIRIKAGTYREQNTIPKGKDFITLIGDGYDKTFLTESKSVIGNGITTMLTATLGVAAKGFQMMGISVVNTAGVANHQAVAFRAASDLSVMYLCAFYGYQDTLYVHNRRQYYRQVIVEGTVDYIFGNAAAIIHKSVLRGRVGNGIVTVTAQGRKIKGQPTGIILLACDVGLNRDLLQKTTATPDNYKNYLGRPWQPYSMTAYINCRLGQGMHPQGWLDWNGQVFNTVEYYEFGSFGPGFFLKNRVSWSKQIPLAKAQEYTLQPFLQASTWLPATGVPYS